MTEWTGGRTPPVRIAGDVSPCLRDGRTMTEIVIKAIGPGRDYPTLAAWAAALPPDLTAIDQCHVAELWADADDPGGAMIETVCDPTRYVIVRAAPGQALSDLADPDADPLAPGPGALIQAASGDAITIVGAGTRVALQSLQIVAQAGSAVSDDGLGACVGLTRCLIDANGADAAASLRGVGALASGTALIQRGSGDGFALADGAVADGCTVFKPGRNVADGFGVSSTGAPATEVRSTIAFGFRQAFGPGIGTADALVSDQTNVIAAPDNFADPFWTAVSSTVDTLDTIPGPFGVPLQRLGNNQNGFARFDGPVVATIAPGETFVFSTIVASPTSLVSAILLDSTAGKPELRVTWTANPPTAALLGMTAQFAARAGSVTEIAPGTYRLLLEAENTTAAPLDVTPIFYVTRGVENVGLNVGMYAGNVMAGTGHLGTGFVFPGAVPGTNALEGVDPVAALADVSGTAPDLRPVTGGPLEGAGGASEPDAYARHRLTPDTAGAVTLNPAPVVTASDLVIEFRVDAARAIDAADILAAQRNRVATPASPSRIVGV